MRIDQLTDLFIKQMGARKDGAAYLLPAETDAVVYVSLAGETLTVSKVNRVEPADPLVYLETSRGERYVVAADDVRALRLDRPEHVRKAGAGFGK
jgi:hypothetical protein